MFRQNVWRLLNVYCSLVSLTKHGKTLGGGYSQKHFGMFLTSGFSIVHQYLILLQYFSFFCGFFSTTDADLLGRWEYSDPFVLKQKTCLLKQTYIHYFFIWTNLSFTYFFHALCKENWWKIHNIIILLIWFASSRFKKEC